MTGTRAVTTCERCRLQKRRCDRRKPRCTRCQDSGAICSFDTPSNTTSYSGSPLWESPARSLRQSPQSDAASTPSPEITSAGRSFRVVRKRNRMRLSCGRCHQQKVKCDRMVPCGRCRAAGVSPTECTYSYQRDGRTTAKSDVLRYDPGHVYNAWHSRNRGSSHWKALFKQIGVLSQLDNPPFFSTFNELSKTNCKHFTGVHLPHNFPFGSPDAQEYSSLQAVLSLLRSSKHKLKSYADSYKDVLQPLYPLQPDFFPDDELWFDSSPSKAIDAPWLANYLMAVGLGCAVSANRKADATPFLFAAEACLMKTSFMFQPCQATLRALCLMVIAKQIVHTSCWAVDSGWSLMGMVVRLAIMVGLHSDQILRLDESGTLDSWRARRSLWTTIVYLAIETSISSGMPSMIRPDEILTGDDPYLLEIGEEILSRTHERKLYNSFPTLLEVVSRVNSNITPLTYEEVLHYNTEVRNLMIQARASIHGLHAISAETFFRRVLLVLHRQFAHHPDAPVLFPVSYWSSLECSLALLIQQRTLRDEKVGDPRAAGVVSSLYNVDFFSAALTSCIHLLNDAPLSLAAEAECEIPPRQTILEMLRWCRETWAETQHSSLCHRGQFQCLDAAMALIPGAN